MPVAIMAVDGAKNAALFAVQIGAAFKRIEKNNMYGIVKICIWKVLADNAEYKDAIKL